MILFVFSKRIHLFNAPCIARDNKIDHELTSNFKKKNKNFAQNDNDITKIKQSLKQSRLYLLLSVIQLPNNDLHIAFTTLHCVVTQILDLLPLIVRKWLLTIVLRLVRI